jgi:chemotaxis protein MotB
MKNIIKNVLLLLVGIIMLHSCVTSKKYKEQESLAKRYLAQKNDCNDRLSNANKEIAELKEAKSNLEELVANLTSDTARLGLENRQLYRTLYDLKSANDQLSEKQKELIAASSAKQDQLIKELAEKKRELELKEAELNALSKSLTDRENKLKQMQSEVDQKSIRINELEASLAAKDSALAQLKSKIIDALKGFSSDELTVEEKNGKVYVSMSEKLLFKSGSFTVDAKGEQALAKIAEVLKKQTDVDIVVEGHTDNVPYKGTGQLQDNWDLSVKRATSVVRILVEKNGLSSDNVTASGRGDTQPVATNDTAEGKAKNRRTDIILAPQLDKLFKIIEGK